MASVRKQHDTAKVGGSPKVRGHNQVEFLLGLYTNFRLECQHLTAAAALGLMSSRDQAIEKRAARIMAEIAEESNGHKIHKEVLTRDNGAASEARAAEAASRCPQPPTTKSRRFRTLVPSPIRRHRNLTDNKETREGERVGKDRHTETANGMPEFLSISGVLGSPALADETTPPQASPHLTRGSINNMEDSNLVVTIAGIEHRDGCKLPSPPALSSWDLQPPSLRPMTARDSCIGKTSPELEVTGDIRPASPLQTLRSYYTQASAGPEMRDSGDACSNTAWDLSGTLTDLMFRTLRFRVSPPPNQQHRAKLIRRQRDPEWGSIKQSKASGSGAGMRRHGEVNWQRLRDGSGNRASARDQLSPDKLEALAEQFDALERRRLDYEERKARPQAKEALRILVHVRFLIWLGGACSRIRRERALRKARALSTLVIQRRWRKHFRLRLDRQLRTFSSIARTFSINLLILRKRRAVSRLITFFQATSTGHARIAMVFRRFHHRVRESQRLSRSYLRLQLARRRLLLRLWDRYEERIRLEHEGSIRRARVKALMVENLSRSRKQSPKDKEWNSLHHQTGLLARRAQRIARPTQPFESTRTPLERRIRVIGEHLRNKQRLYRERCVLRTSKDLVDTQKTFCPEDAAMLIHSEQDDTTKVLIDKVTAALASARRCPPFLPYTDPNLGPSWRSIVKAEVLKQIHDDIAERLAYSTIPMVLMYNGMSHRRKVPRPRSRLVEELVNRR